MDKPIIEVKNLGKKYTITHMRGNYIAMRDVLANALRNPFSFLKTKTRQAVGLEKKEEFWALKNISFNIGRGEVIGVIGANGAGKSTLLKILSQITPPTEGEVILRGRVGSLLEVGTGFHPELTGRENIFLNGAILGMKKREIEKKFDEIVTFAGVEKFLDTPVKFYSSGMHVRLAFSVAAHMEPDILLVDEVLAVGDAEFQKKCLGKMDEITKNEGRTIIFVSHNMGAIEELCEKSILVKNGQIEKVGPTSEIIGYYRKNTDLTKIDFSNSRNRRGNGKIRLVGFHVENEKKEETSFIKYGSRATFVFTYECKDPQTVSSVDIGFGINKYSNTVGVQYSSYMNTLFDNIKEHGDFRFHIESMPLSEGQYGITSRIVVNGIESDWIRDDIGKIEIIRSDLQATNNQKFHPDSSIVFEGEWTHD